MKIHWLQHVPFEGLGCIEPWLIEKGYDVSCTQLWNGDMLPASGSLDGLIVMGGPMGICDEDLHPWLVAEKSFVKEIVDQNKPVLGICLGAQLIAEVLGAEVYPGQEKEIGFFPTCGRNVSNGWKLPDEFVAFHWHGDTFGIPDGAVQLASSEATENQAFVYNGNVLALQFHLETTEESLLALYKNCSDEIVEAPFIQSLPALHRSQSDAGGEMRENFPMLGNCNALMNDLLGKLFIS